VSKVAFLASCDPQNLRSSIALARMKWATPGFFWPAIFVVVVPTGVPRN